MAKKTSTPVTSKPRRTRIDGVLVAYDDAKKDITIQRTLMDVWKGKEGEAGKCMNAVCIARNGKAFPHKVLAASVIKSRVFILDRVDHAVRYTLSRTDSELIDQHDTLAVGKPGTLTLHAPRGLAASGANHGNHQRSGPHNPKGKHNKPLSKGEQARVMAAVGVKT